MQQPTWTVSNFLSLARVLLVIPIAKLVMMDDPVSHYLAAGLIVIAASTDFFDGLIARRFKQVTDFGKIVDPLADKIAVAVLVLILTQQGKLPLWFLILVLLRDGAIFAGGAYIRRTKGLVLQSNVVGKWAAAIIAVLILHSVLDIRDIRWLDSPLLVGSTGFLVLSFVLYLQRFLAVLQVRESGIL